MPAGLELLTSVVRLLSRLLIRLLVAVVKPLPMSEVLFLVQADATNEALLKLAVGEYAFFAVVLITSDVLGKGVW